MIAVCGDDGGHSWNRQLYYREGSLKAEFIECVVWKLLVVSLTSLFVLNFLGRLKRESVDECEPMYRGRHSNSGWEDRMIVGASCLPR